MTFNICPSCGSREFRNVPGGTTPPPQQAPFAPNAQVSTSNPRLRLIIGCFVALFVLVALGVYLKDQADVRKHEALAKIEVDAKRADIELELERQRRAAQNEREIENARRTAQEQLDAERRAKQGLEAAAAGERRMEAERTAIGKIEKSARASLAKEGTRVLQLRNISDVPVDFHLKCCTEDMSCKTLFVSIPARSEKEIGFLEGWGGNFVSGETCEARYLDERVWKIHFQ